VIPIVDGPVIVVDAHNSLVSGGVCTSFQSIAYAQQLARRHSIGYNEAWVYVSVVMDTYTQWFKCTYYYNGHREAGYKPPKDCTWDQLIWEWEQSVGKAPMVKAAGTTS